MRNQNKVIMLSVMFLVVLLGCAAFADIQSDVNTIARGNNIFALELYQELRTGNENIFFSPYSISTALAMTYAGARGNTAKQMAEALQFSFDHFSKFGEFQLSDITHDYPEWKQYLNSFKSPGPDGKRFLVNPQSFFQNPDLNRSQHLTKYLKGNDPFRVVDSETLECSQELFLESLDIEKIWDL